MRKFLIKIAIAFLPVVFMWGGLYIYYYSVVCPNQSGDIGSLGKIPFGKEYETEFSKDFSSYMVCVTDTSKVLTQDTSIHVGVVGDSFSHRGNTGYVNFMGKYLGGKVAFFDWDWPNPKYDPTLTLIGLLNSGYFEGTSIHTLVLSVVERNFVPNILGADLSYSKNNLRFHHGDNKGKNIQVKEKAQERSIQEARNFLLLRFGYMSRIGKEKLDRNFFTLRPRDLYYYSYDTNRLTITRQEQRTIKEKLMALRMLAESKGIRLLILMPVDKYDLYEPYIVGKRHPRIETCEIVRTLADTSYLILAKPYLREMLAKGEKDVFLANDTHWSYKAADVMGKVLAQKIREKVR